MYGRTDMHNIEHHYHHCHYDGYCEYLKIISLWTILPILPIDDAENIEKTKWKHRIIVGIDHIVNRVNTYNAVNIEQMFDNEKYHYRQCLQQTNVCDIVMDLPSKHKLQVTQMKTRDVSEASHTHT